MGAWGIKALERDEGLDVLGVQYLRRAGPISRFPTLFAPL